MDNTLLELQNSSYPTQPHSIIAKYMSLVGWEVRTGNCDRGVENAVFSRPRSQFSLYGPTLRACSHGGGGPQVGEVPHLPVVKES